MAKDETVKRLTAKAVEKELKKRFGKMAVGVKLQQAIAKDYWYFSGGLADGFEEQGVYTMRLSDMSMDGWMNEFQEKLDDSYGDRTPAGKLKKHVTNNTIRYNVDNGG